MNFIFIVVTFFCLYASLEALGVNFKVFINKAILSTPKIKIFVYHIFVFYLILVGTKVVIILIEASVNKREHANAIEKGKAQSIYQIVKYIVYVIAITLFIDSLGFNITILIASLSALLIGLGLGIQHIFNDVISGFIILFDRVIKVGDVVELNNGLIGQVSKIGLRTSHIITRADVEVIIPNGRFTVENIINWTHNSTTTRFSVDVGVAYGSDVRLVEKLLVIAATTNETVCKDPLPHVQFIDFGESSLNFRLFFFSEDNFRVERVKSEIRFEIDRLFRENKVSIPFPQRDLHIIEKQK